MTCPVGKVAVGGGVLSKNYTELVESGPGVTNGQSSWLVAIRSLTYLDNNRVVVTVQCADAPAGYEVARRDSALAAGAVLRGTVSCPTGKVALSGGAAVVGEGSADFHTTMEESGPRVGRAPAGWVNVVRNWDGVPHTVGQFVICSNAPSGYQILQKSRTLQPQNWLTSNGANLDCGAGKVPYGGGILVTGSTATDNHVFMRDSGPHLMPWATPLPATWTVGVLNLDEVDHTVTAYGICVNR